MALPFFKGGKQMIRKMIRKIDSMTPHRSSSGTRLWAGWTKEFRTPGKKYG